MTYSLISLAYFKNRIFLITKEKQNTSKGSVMPSILSVWAAGKKKGLLFPLLRLQQE
jgi:hypothetical protein